MVQIQTVCFLSTWITVIMSKIRNNQADLKYDAANLSPHQFTVPLASKSTPVNLIVEDERSFANGSRLPILKGSKVDQESLKTAISFCICNDLKNDCDQISKLCNIDQIDLLLSNGADPDGSDYPYLHIFIWEDKKTILRLLLKYGADVNRQLGGYSPLGRAINFKRTEIFELLLEQPGIDVTCCIPVDPTFPSIFEYLVTWAAKEGEVDLVKMWLDKKPDINWEEHSQMSVELAVQSAKTDEVGVAFLRLFIRRGANITYDGDRDYPPFVFAITQNYTQTSLLLIDNGINYQLWKKLWNVWGPLYRVLARNMCEVANRLVTSGHELKPTIGHRSVISLTYRCSSTLRLILKSLLYMNITDPTVSMDIEIGGEVFLPLLPELLGKVIVINWEKLSWFYYTLDREAHRMVTQENKNKTEEIKSMVILAPYPHLFLLVTDYRMYLLNMIAIIPPEQSCSSANECQTVPDVFWIIWEKTSDICIAFDFYAPVLEYLDMTPVFQSLLDHRKYIFTSMIVFFIGISLPIGSLAFHLLKGLFREKTVTKNNNNAECPPIQVKECLCKSERFGADSSLNNFQPKQEDKLVSRSSAPVRLACSILFYSCIGLANVYIYQLTKQSIYLVVDGIMKRLSYNNSLWVILVFKYLNTLVIEHQPGSPCAGDIFANVYNVKLSFWLTENSVITSANIKNLREQTTDTAKQLDDIKTHMLYLLGRPDKESDAGNYQSRIDSLVNSSIAVIESSILCSPEKWEQAFNLLIESSPTLIWESKWLSQKSWKTPLYIDVIGKTCSVLFHILCILIFRSLNLYSKMFSLWKSSNSKKRRKFYFCIILAVAVNVSLKISCLNAGRSLFGNLLLRILLIILVTPSSVICEWFVYRLIYIYCDVFVSSLAFFLCKMNSNDLALVSLSSMYLSKEDVEEANQDVLRATLPVKHKLEEFSDHSVEVVSTGSIFERYGKPLNASTLETNLKSDYDVMFAFQKDELLVETVMKNYEFVHVFVLSDSCKLLNTLKKFDASNKSFKLSAKRARQFMKRVVQDVPVYSMDSNRKARYLHNFLNLFAFLFNVPRLGKWIIQKAQTIGPAANYLVQSGSPLSAQDWTKNLDYDILISIELNSWPSSASTWETRQRKWPSEEVIRLVIASGCQIVPKEDPTGDELSWRLSFSRGELLLSSEVPAKARDVYVAVKLFWKNHMKAECSALRSYHLKTLLYNYLEVTDQADIEDKEVEDTARNFLIFIQSSLEAKVCKHYFIDTINLFECLCSSTITDQVNTCISIIESSVNKNILLSTLLSRNSKNVLALTYFRDNNPILYVFYTIILQIINIAAVFGGAFVYATGLLLILSHLISFLYSSLILVPSIVILLCTYFGIKFVTTKITYMFFT